ncbi:hypothetical protein [Streptomyces sp. or20]|uniref:hypothetical protein n=1 Tax=Streptomyces sp. or20 TaxID=1828016 RepID=UPI001C54C3FF|nr:hypothetical protein [Streptomyces sp. or20]
MINSSASRGSGSTAPMAAPRGATASSPTTPAASSLLHSIVDVLDPYFEGDAKSAEEQFIARALYEPLRRMLTRLLTDPPRPAGTQVPHLTSH